MIMPMDTRLGARSFFRGIRLTPMVMVLLILTISIPNDPDVQYDPLDQTDTDGDGVRDVGDADPNDPDVQFHPADETDTDGDGVIGIDDADPNDPDVQ